VEPHPAPVAQAAPPSVRLKPRFSIKPSEPEAPRETISIPGLSSVLPPIGSANSGLPENPGEKVKIDLGPFTRPLEGGSPAGAISANLPPGGEKTEVAFKFKLKPASVVDLPESSALPGAVEAKPLEVTIFRQVTAIPGAPVGKPPPTPAPSLQTQEVSTAKKPSRTLLALLAGLLVFCGACYFWFFVRVPKPAAVVPPPAVGAKQPPPAVGEAASRASAGVAADHPAAVGQSPEHATTGAPVASSAETPGTLAPASPSVPAGVNPPPPPPPPEPTLQFRAFVDHLKINGVRTGPPPRLFVDGISCRPGDVLDHDLGVIFDGLDTTSDEIIFKDATGAVVRRRF
jgi:hypothetical protein